MIILGLEFIALIVICYMFLVYVTRDRVSEKKQIPGWAVWAVILILVVMMLLVSWYIRLGLAS